ncbi:MAG: hypothetical protein KG003_14475 [Bacteroidetes bacterium]|nr:hypothetical protein [Bacteroidota bacterium]
MRIFILFIFHIAFYNFSFGQSFGLGTFSFAPIDNPRSFTIFPEFRYNILHRGHHIFGVSYARIKKTDYDIFSSIKTRTNYLLKIRNSAQQIGLNYTALFNTKNRFIYSFHAENGLWVFRQLKTESWDGYYSRFLYKDFGWSAGCGLGLDFHFPRWYRISFGSNFITGVLRGAKMDDDAYNPDYLISGHYAYYKLNIQARYLIHKGKAL